MLNNPFYYTPDALTLAACDEVRRRIADYARRHASWHDEVAKGKMFGVLVACDNEGNRHTLAAYSGQIGGRADWAGFVPPVLDYLQPDGYFIAQEREISAINHRIDELQADPAYVALKEQLATIRQRQTAQTAAFQEKMREAKRRRDARRPTATPNEQAAMIRESQWMKAELRRIRQRQRKEVEDMERLEALTEDEVARLRQERKRQSDHLQHWLFSHFEVRNARGEVRTLTDIFAPTPQGTPPSGAGECCAPKLLQYAYLHGLTPLRIAEFWMGASPVGEIRREGCFYPACRSKCLPILQFMLQGIEVEPNPLETHVSQDLETIYDDRHLVVVCKPADMLAVPGKSGSESVYSLLRRRYPEAEGPMIVHRLDMATSGLMVVAKSTWVYRELQRQFEQRLVSKRYIALLEGDISGQAAASGTIRLPLRPDLTDRPRQMVDPVHGKEAVTDYQVIGTERGHTRIALYPRTGRTHQLRVHCAHPDGLGTPILGDALYGQQAERLYLHAERLTFTHPATNEEMTFRASPAPPPPKEGDAK